MEVNNFEIFFLVLVNKTYKNALSEEYKYRFQLKICQVSEKNQ